MRSLGDSPRLSPPAGGMFSGIWAPGARGEAPYKTRGWDQKVVIYSYHLYLYEGTSSSVGKVGDGERKGRGFESIVGFSILLSV